MSGANGDRKRSGYLRQVNSSSESAAAANQDNSKRTRLQSNAYAATTTTTTTAPQMVLQMEYIDKHSRQEKKEVFGPLPIADLLQVIRKKLLQLQKDYPISRGVRYLLDEFSEAKIQPLAMNLNHPMYCLPLISLSKSKEIEQCGLNNGQNFVLARISENNEIVLFLRIHPIKDNYRLFMEGSILVPEWLEDDVRETMSNLIESDAEVLLRHRDRSAPQSSYIDDAKASIKTGLFTTPYPNIKYVHQIQCPTIWVCLEAPMPKIEEVVSPELNELCFECLDPLPFQTPNIFDFFPTSDTNESFRMPAAPTPDFPNILDGVNSSLDNDFLAWPDFELFSPPPESTQPVQPPQPLIFTNQVCSNSNVTKQLPKPNCRYNRG
jgi:hypothetical protein